MKLSVITPTHDPKWLPELWASLQAQTHRNFEWVQYVNDGGRSSIYPVYEPPDVRVHPVLAEGSRSGVGAIKKAAFSHGTGEILVELDHDDLLLPTALEEIAKAFEDPEVGFVYSDFADFEDGAVGQGTPTYRRPDVRAGWVANGFQFYEAELGGVRPGRYECVRSFPPSALANSLIYWAPNHVRAWRRSVYEQVGGHNPDLRLCDDHELVARTYLATRMLHIPKPLYLYRVSGDNTWAKNVEEIRLRTHIIRDEYLERLVLRECELLGLPAYDLGGGIDPRPDWKTVDREGRVDRYVDLAEIRWPFADSSIGAFRAHDLLEHLPNKTHTMREIWRCLRPGGWLLSMTPSTDGRGAFQDPTHVSYWNQNAFWYWTRAQQAKYIHNNVVRFQEHTLDTVFPSIWHEVNKIPYVRANLVALKPGYEGPGEKFI